MLSLEKERLYYLLENVGGSNFLSVVKYIKQTTCSRKWKPRLAKMKNVFLVSGGAWLVAPCFT